MRFEADLPYGSSGVRSHHKSPPTKKKALRTAVRIRTYLNATAAARFHSEAGNAKFDES